MQTVQSVFVLAMSPKARTYRREQLAIKTLLEKAFSDPDQVVHIRIRPRGKAIGASRASLLLLLLLIGAAVIEWRTLTLPAITQWLQTVEHQCGFN